MLNKGILLPPAPRPLTLIRILSLWLRLHFKLYFSKSWDLFFFLAFKAIFKSAFFLILKFYYSLHFQDTEWIKVFIRLEKWNLKIKLSENAPQNFYKPLFVLSYKEIKVHMVVKLKG